MGNEMTTILMTSLAEIKSFRPCASGWVKIREAHPNNNLDEQFPLVDCIKSNSITDVLWLIGKRRVEIQIAVRFARMCADSVAHLKNEQAAYTAATYAAYAATYATDAATAYATDAATYATYAAYAADATYAAADATDAAYAADAYETQQELNKQFLIQCINEFTSEGRD